jgi:hypothetical protein
MELPDHEIEHLAGFFAKRFPSFEERVSLARQVGLVGLAQVSGDAFRAWSDLVRLAGAAGRLPALVSAAARRRPADAALHEMVESVVYNVRDGGVSSRWTLVGGVGLLVAVLLLGFAVGRCSKGDAPGRAMAPASSQGNPASSQGYPASSQGYPASSQGGRVAAQLASPGAQRPEAPVFSGPPTEVGGQWVASGVPGAASPDGSAAVVAPGFGRNLLQPRSELEILASLAPGEEVDPKTVAKATGGRCEGKGGQLLGWWFAGHEVPAAVGQSYVVKAPHNVNAGTPGPENKWSSKGPVACTLRVGDVVTLRREPLKTSGGNYWIPVWAGDFVSGR